MQYQLAFLALTSALFSQSWAMPTTFLERTATTYTTNATYYQGDLNPGAACSSSATKVATGNITTGVCYTAYTYGVSMQPFKTQTCTYTLFQGTANCQGATSSSTTSLPAGGSPVCIATGVYDGGNHQHASGMLSC